MFFMPANFGYGITNGTNTELILEEVKAPANVCVSICRVLVSAYTGSETAGTDNMWKIRLLEESTGATNMTVNNGSSVNNGGEIASQAIPSYWTATVGTTNVGTVVREFSKGILNENFVHYEWRATDADDMFTPLPGNIFAVAVTPGQDTASDILCEIFWIE